MMNRLFGKKSKKSLKSSQGHTPPGIPINVAAGPPGFRADLDIGPAGEQDRPHLGLRADRPDLTVALDERDTRGSRVVFQEDKGEDQEFAVAEDPTPGTMVSGTEHGGDTTSECFRSLPSQPIFT